MAKLVRNAGRSTVNCRNWIFFYLEVPQNLGWRKSYWLDWGKGWVHPNERKFVVRAGKLAYSLVLAFRLTLLIIFLQNWDAR